jgi:hypothetical protein
MRTPLEWTLTLLALGCLIGMIAGWVGKHPRRTRLRLLNKPQGRDLSVLVPPGTAPRLVPGDAPNATRPTGTRAPLTRHPPAVVTHVDYLAAFADPGKGKDTGQVDYVLLSTDERR